LFTLVYYINPIATDIELYIEQRRQSHNNNHDSV